MAENTSESSGLFKDLGSNEFIIELDGLTAAEIDAKMAGLLNELSSLTENSALKLNIQGQAFSEAHAKLILERLKTPEHALFTTEINLPSPIENTRIQIELDNLISNNQLAKKAKLLDEANTNDGSDKAKKTSGRTLPKGKIKPKIVITLFEKITHEEAIEPEEILRDNEVDTKETVEQPQTTRRSPLAERVLVDILANPERKKEKKAWEALTNRKEAQKFRQDLLASPSKNHPIHHLIRKEPNLQKALTTWTKTLSLKKEQYDAMADVYGQYGAAGLKNLFATWDFCDSDSFKKDALKETHQILLQHMPSFIPMVKDQAYKEVITKIANLSKEKRSWWVALVTNQMNHKGYADLPYLFKTFTNATVTIEEMGLSFNTVIDGIKDQRDIASTLTSMITLLKKCPEQDRRIQWKYIHKVDITKQKGVHFVIPEMKLENKKCPTMEEMKAIIEDNADTDPHSIKPTFYRYIASKKYHLPLEKYEKIFDEIFSPDFSHKGKYISDRSKIRMAYVLALTTSTNDAQGFNNERVFEEWECFKDRTTKLEYMDRVKKNSSIPTMVINAAAPDELVRGKVLQPIMMMPYVPPTSFLNKLLTLSEYRFLAPGLSLNDMEDHQKDMQIKIDSIALVYKTHARQLEQAIRFIHTKTVELNPSTGKYNPEQKNVTLLETFISACKTLVDEKHNRYDAPNKNPQEVFLPLVTTFNLEYASKSNDALSSLSPAQIEQIVKEEIEQLIKKYNERMNKNTKYKDQVQTLLPYGLSLLQYINDRDGLNKQTLNTFQDELVKRICTPESITRKGIREWMHEKYGAHFPGSLLLDIKDEVSFSELFDRINCTNPKTRKAIEQLVANFDNDDEKSAHEALATNLVTLTNSLSKVQSEQFFEYCRKSLKTNGLLTRKMQGKLPSYIAQFSTLVQHLTELKSTTEFNRYMNIVAERVPKESKNRNNHLEKCNYLLSTLYPALIQKGIERKAAFNFAAALVCNTPLSALKKSHEQVNYTAPELISPQLNAELTQQIDTFNKLPVRNLTDLTELRNKIEAITKLSAKNSEFFNNGRELVDLINEIQEAIEARTKEHNRLFVLKRWFNNMKDLVSNDKLYIGRMSPDEFVRLQEAGLTNLTDHTRKEIHNYNRQMTTRFQDVVAYLFNKKSQLIEKYGNISIRANNFIDKALLLSPNDVSKNSNNISQLIDDLIALNDQNLVLSLMYHYAGGIPGRGVNDLVELFNSKQYMGLASNQKKDFLNLLMTQMNNDVKCGKKDVTTLLQFVFEKKDNKVVMGCMHDYYQQAPYPPIEKFILWTKYLDNRKAIDKAYAVYDRNPCALSSGHNGREVENGFKLKQAEKIVAQMPEIQKRFDREYLIEVENAGKIAKGLRTEKIIELLKQFKDKPPKDHINMVMLAAELMHRCKGRTPEFVADRQILGRSFELNTTQIIAILAMLETGKKVTAEIGTGEGKSRIMMMLNACQFLKGMTVDFVTIPGLIERDTLEFMPFAQSLGAKVSLITASSDISDYQIGGINCSDSASLCLFRNKAISQNKADCVFDPDPAKRHLSLDEADATYFDLSNTKYNFSSKIPKLNTDLLPVYPLLMEFFAQNETEKTYLKNKQRCNEQLRDFIETRNPALFKIMKKQVSDAMLEKMQDSAYIARHLEYNVDYAVVSEATIPTELGDKKVAAAMCLVGSRINKNAKFKDVHACLHAELNRLMKLPKSEQSDQNLARALAQCKRKDRSFEIEAEGQISFSSSSNSMLQDYKKGSLMAVTGTVGSALEKQEAQSQFKTKFIHVPRHKGMHRYDRPTLICETEEKYIDLFVKSILEARKKGEPVLIICKDDNHSRKVHTALEERLAGQRDSKGLPNLTRIHAATDFEDNISEMDYIKNKAGKPGQVTITTDMEGRGTDIHPGPAGLTVLLGYLPSNERDYLQIVGRSGRFGQIGKSQMILNMEMLAEDFGIDKLNRDFYLNPEAFIRRLQIFASITKELQRLFHTSYDNLLNTYTKQYGEYLALCTDEASIKCATEAWSLFLDQYHLNQDISQQAIEAQLQLQRPNISVIETKLNDQSHKAKDLWQAFTQRMHDELKIPMQPAVAHEMKKPELLTKWLEEMKRLQKEDKDFVEVDEVRKVRVHREYDSETAGRLNILKHPSTFLPNLRNWWKGEGPLFPNLKSWWAGDLSFADLFGLFPNIRAWWKGEGLLFPNLQAWWSGNLSFKNMVSQWPLIRIFVHPQEEVRTVKIEVSSTYSMFLKEHPEMMSNSDDDLDNDDTLKVDDSYSPLWNSDKENVDLPKNIPKDNTAPPEDAEKPPSPKQMNA